MTKTPVEHAPPLGAVRMPDGHTVFRVWAPRHRKVEVRLSFPQEKRLLLKADANGYFALSTDDIPPAGRYRYRLDGTHEYPDPASRHQPEGVHGPSEIVPLDFAWHDQGWKGIPLSDYALYELHVGTFTDEGTFVGAIQQLDGLKELGVTAVELMPVAQFPGGRNWGYDGVFPFSVQNTYGGPAGLKSFVNACHARGLAVVLDVVYNHLGPEGNILPCYGPYFTDYYKTPWGAALNFDQAGSDGVKRYFIENALQWVRDFHVDALRLDAIHGIYDSSARPFLRMLADEVHAYAKESGRNIFLIAESDLNNAAILRPPAEGGVGLDAQWNDDYHHALHALLTGEKQGYYEDFGCVGQLAKAWREGYVFTGQYSNFRGRTHGDSTKGISSGRFVVFSQNHDQTGNRAEGNRLTDLVSFEELKLAAACTILSPNVPLLFMGEEYGETAPFQYFISHSDAELIEAVRRGRQSEFKAFHWEGEIPDPQDENIFLQCKLCPHLKKEASHKTLFSFYQELLRLRKTHPALKGPAKAMDITSLEKEQVFFAVRSHEGDKTCTVFNFSKRPQSVQAVWGGNVWHKALDSADPQWKGKTGVTPAQVKNEAVIDLSPSSAALFFNVRP